MSSIYDWKLAKALVTILGIAELDVLDDKSIVWRNAMQSAREALESYDNECVRCEPHALQPCSQKCPIQRNAK